MHRKDLATAFAAGVSMTLFSSFITVLGFLFLASVLNSRAYGRDDGQWELTDPIVRKWFEGLKQPDYPNVSCCSFADAYYASKFLVENGTTVAIITDTRDDGPLGRPHIEPGTRYAVPDTKMIRQGGNPTGEGVIFIGGGGQVLCYVLPELV